MSIQNVLKTCIAAIVLLLISAAPGWAQGDCSAPTLSINLLSSSVTNGNGVFDYAVNLSAAQTPCFVNNMDFNFTGMAGVTGASVLGGSQLASDALMTVNNFTSTSAEFQVGSQGGLFFGGNNGTLVIDCSSCAAGTIDWSITAILDPSGTVSGPVAAPVAGAAETGSFVLMLAGLAGLGFWLLLVRRRQQAVVLA